MIDSSDRLRISLRFAIPTIWVAFALSVIFHAAVLWGWHPVEKHDFTFDQVGPGKSSGPLVLQIAPQPSRATSPPPAPPSAPSASAVETPPARKPPVAKPAPHPPPPPPVLAQEKPAPVAVPPPKPAAPPPAPA